MLRRLVERGIGIRRARMSLHHDAGADVYGDVGPEGRAFLGNRHIRIGRIGEVLLDDGRNFALDMLSQRIPDIELFTVNR